MIIVVRSCQAVLFSHTAISIVSNESKPISFLQLFEHIQAFQKVSHQRKSFTLRPQHLFGPTAEVQKRLQGKIQTGTFQEDKNLTKRNINFRSLSNLCIFVCTYLVRLQFVRRYFVHLCSDFWIP